MSALRNRVIPFAKLSDLQEGEPELKCLTCSGDGALPVFDAQGNQVCTTTCPTCGGTRYAP